jgi:hypothetical protein
MNGPGERQYMGGINKNHGLPGSRLIRMLAFIMASAAALAAQSFLNPLTTAGMNERGVHLYGVSIFSGVSTVDNAALQLVTGVAADRPGYTTSSGVSAAFGVNFANGERSNFSAMYSGSYSYQTYGYNVGTTDHSAALSWGRKLAPKWRATSSFSAALGSFNQLVFAPTTAQSIATLAGTFDDVSGAVMNGQGTNAGVVSAVTSVSAAVSPQQRLLFGDRLLTANGGFSLSYSHSPRLTFGVNVGGTRMQHLNSKNSATDQNYFNIAQESSLSAGFSMGYTLSPRTTLTGSVTYGRSLSSINDAQYDSFQVGVGHKLSPRWFVQGAAGGGYVLPGKQAYSTRGVQSLVTGTIGYRPHAGHSLMASVYRSVSDYYGIATGATFGTSVGWAWSPVGWNWGLHAAINEDRLLGNALGNSGYRMNVGMNRRLGRQTSVTVQYAYAVADGNLVEANNSIGPRFNFKQHSVRMSFTWGGLGADGGASGSPGAAGSAGSAVQ